MDLEIHDAMKGFPPSVCYQDVRDVANQRRTVDPITVLDGQILDGRTRYRVCCELGIEPPLDEVDPETNPYEVVWEKNRRRGDLEGVQKYLAWWWCYEKADRWHEDRERLSGSRFRTQRPNTPRQKNKQRKVSIADCVKLAVVKPAAVEIGDRLLRKDPELAEQVRMGRMSPAEAIRQLKK